jgi:hypothetical protein
MYAMIPAPIQKQLEDAALTGASGIIAYLVGVLLGGVLQTVPQP